MKENDMAHIENNVSAERLAKLPVPLRSHGDDFVPRQMCQLQSVHAHGACAIRAVTGSTPS